MSTESKAGNAPSDQVVETPPRRRRHVVRAGLQAYAGDDALLYVETVSSWVGLSRSAIYALVQRGTFPPPLRLGKRCSRWLAGDVRRWVKDLSEASGAGRHIGKASPRVSS